MEQAIIFDLYDTLIHSTIKHKPYRKFFFSLGLTIPEMGKWVENIMIQDYKGFEEIKHKINPDISMDFTELNKELEEELDSTILFDDTQMVLEQLSKKYRLFVFSNLATPYTKPYYKLGLDKWIEKPFFSCEIGLKKPDAKAFNYVAKQIGLSKSNLTMIGDNPISDYQGAQNAGIRAILKDKPLQFICQNLV